MSAIAMVLAIAKERKRKFGSPTSSIKIHPNMFDLLEAECEGILYQGCTLCGVLMIGPLQVVRGSDQF